MDSQRTLRRQVSCAGIGLHSGNKVTLTLRPAPANSGIRFRRTDLGGLEIEATIGNLAGIQYATGLAQNEGSVETVEHLLAALASLGIDNVVVELNYPEVPIMDGSAAPFVYLIHEAGIRDLGVPRRFLRVTRPDRTRARRQAHRALPERALQGHLLDQLRSPAAPPPGPDDDDHRGGVRGADRAGAHVHVPEGSGAAAPARLRARRLARERGGDRRHRRAEPPAPVRGRVRPPQDPRRHRRPGAASGSR